MNWKLLHEADGQRTFAVIFDSGDEVTHGLLAFAKEQDLKASQFTAIGAFNDLVVGYFDWATKKYNPIPIREQVEVLMLAGDVSLKDSEPQVHAHVVVGKADGTAHGGHLIEAHVRPTLEVVLIESPSYLEREMDKATGIALIRVG